jgi:hypothetical protein
MKRKTKLPSVTGDASTSVIDLPTLQDIRNKAVRDRFETREAIAGIEAWIEEAHATIAFLKVRNE